MILRTVLAAALLYGDGWLSGAEAARRPEVAAGFKRADADRDGRLSFAEFESIALKR